jgi:5-methyltetrahydropteroyltriglutamate--homocysteine methyltransferase
MKPPFRADQVGSLLRPPELREARAKAKRGEISAEALRKVEGAAIRQAVDRQQAIGLEAITDGEFRRDWWHVDFLTGFEGVESYAAPLVVGFHNTEEQPPMLRVTGKVRRTRPVFVDSFRFLKQATQRTAKQTIPAPAMLHMRPGRAGISREAYPHLEEFWHDVALAYRAEIRDLAAAAAPTCSSTIRASRTCATRNSARPCASGATIRRAWSEPMPRRSTTRSRIAPRG